MTPSTSSFLFLLSILLASILLLLIFKTSSIYLLNNGSGSGFGSGYGKGQLIEGMRSYNLSPLSPNKIGSDKLLDDVLPSKKPQLTDLTIPELSTMKPRSKMASYEQINSNQVDWLMVNNGTCYPFELCPEAIYNKKHLSHSNPSSPPSSPPSSSPSSNRTEQIRTHIMRPIDLDDIPRPPISTERYETRVNYFIHKRYL